MVALRPIRAEDRALLERLWQLYRHDLSEFRGSHGPDGFRGTLPDEDGLYAVRMLLPFLDADPDRRAYLIHEDARPVGFALVTGVAAEPRMVYEFFVVRGARGRGVARAAAHDLLARHPGAWEIAFQERNARAARFWRQLARHVAGEEVREALRPVPGKPDVPPDVWLTFSVGPADPA